MTVLLQWRVRGGKEDQPYGAKRKRLSRAELVVNLEECKWCPAMRCTWLGFELDLERGCISAPPDKVNTIKMQIRLQ